MTIDPDTVARFASLHQGLPTAFGTGGGGWVKRVLTEDDWFRHLNGRGSGIGVAPLRLDDTVLFAAIDLDEPDFEAAAEMQEYLPGMSWLERSRSGNCHVWVYFREPLEAWVAVGVLKEATMAAGKSHVEVFPKQAMRYEAGMLGSYINLPFHGMRRPILFMDEGALCDMDLEDFLDRAVDTRNDPEDWRRKAKWLLISAPGERAPSSEFGTRDNLHICAEHVLSGEAGMVTEGHRNGTLFMVAKCLVNWRQLGNEEAWMIFKDFNEAGVEPSAPQAELRRIFNNAVRGRFTSTGCTDPVVMPYRHPDCPLVG